MARQYVHTCGECSRYVEFCQTEGKVCEAMINGCIPMRQLDGSFRYVCYTPVGQKAAFVSWLHGRDEDSPRELDIEIYEQLEDRFGRG